MQEMLIEMADAILPVPVKRWLDKESGEMRSVEDATVMELFAKIVEETSEAMREFAKMKVQIAMGDGEAAERYRQSLGMELTDISTAVTTLLEKMGFGIYDRINLIRVVNEKNRKRGYHAAE